MNILKKVTSGILLIAGCMFLTSACENFVGGDTNEDPNRLFEDDIRLQDLLPPIQVNSAEVHFDIAFTTAQYAQHISFVGNTDSHEESTLNSAWIEVYLGSLNNLEILASKSEEAGAAHYLGIAKVLQAMNLGLATNAWEDIPYTEAFTEGEFTPVYDSQEQIYSTIQTLLDEAIIEFQKPDSEFNEPGSDDLIYGGDIGKWIKAANALKARYAIHLTNKGTVDAANGALEALSASFTGNTDDAQVRFNNEKNLNPWHTSAFLAAQTGNPAPVHSDQIIDMMNGTSYPEVDPRLPIIASKGSADEFYGSVNGSFGINPEGPDNSSTTEFTGETWYSQAAAPILMVTYSETKFIEAEAAFLRDNSGDRLATGASQQAYDAYMEGIHSHMDKIGVAAADRDAYMSESSVDVGPANLTMELIMKEKFKALFLNPETFNDLRRYDFDPAIFKDLELPNDHNPELNGEWIQRAVYPNSEFSRNETEVRKAVKDIDVQMWFYSN